MPLIFEVEEKPQYQSKTVFGVEIPIYGELTVNEVIAVEKAIMSEIDHNVASSTEWAMVQVSAWLSARLNCSRKEIDAQLIKSKALIDALWEVFYDEKESNTEGYEPKTDEGKDSAPAPSKTSKKNGTQSTLNSQVADLHENSLVILDNSVSA